MILSVLWSSEARHDYCRQGSQNQRVNFGRHTSQNNSSVECQRRALRFSPSGLEE